jgi:hypothetical protein
MAATGSCRISSPGIAPQRRDFGHVSLLHRIFRDQVIDPEMK